MLVLGLDPGLATVGYGLVSDDGQGLTAHAYGTFHTQANQPVTKRLLTIAEELRSLIARYQPEAAAVEELFFSKNARTAMKVGEGRGALLLTLGEAGIPIAEYTPMQIKQAVTGQGGAEKAQVQYMVRALLRLEETPRPDDAADALAAAICHHHAAKLNSLVAQSQG